MTTSSDAPIGVGRGRPTAGTRRLIGLGVGTALAIGIAAAIASGSRAAPTPAAPAAFVAESTAVPTADPAAAYAMMVSESEYCNCEKAPAP